MKLRRLLRPGLTALAILTLGCGTAAARLSHAEGSLAFAPLGEREWSDRLPQRPLARGDRLWFDKGSRAELLLGPAAVRLAGPAHLAVSAIDPRTVQLNLSQGTAQTRLRDLQQDQHFEIDTPQLAFRALQPGSYRVDVDPARAVTRVSVHAGSGVVYGQGGQALTLAAGQQVTFSGRAWAQVAARPVTQDSFDQWSAERDRVQVGAPSPIPMPAAAVARTEGQRPAPRQAQIRRQAAQPVAQARRPAARPQGEVQKGVAQAQGQAYVLGGPAAAEHMAPADYQREASHRSRPAQDGIPILRQF